MRYLTLDVAALDTSRRLIEGTAVPYNETAEIGMERYLFRPGSLSRARDVTPLLLGHDTNAPVGVVSRIVDGEAGAQLQARVDRTADGDVALEQAKSGSRSGLSIGFELAPAGWRELPDGTIEVSAARVYEVSLVAVPAFAGAHVERVAASREAPAEELAEEPEEPAEPGPDQMQIDAGDAGAEEEGTMQEQETTTAAARPAMILAERTPPARDLGAGELVSLIVRAQHGEAEANRLLTAALTESISTDVSGLLPPTYERTVIGGKEQARPLYDAFRSRPLPGVGLQVNKPVWTTHPDGAWAATVDADATTGKVVIGAQSAVVARWDWAGAIPWVVVQRSDPSIVDEIYAEAVQDWYYDVEAKVYGELGAAAPGVATTMGAAIAEFHTATGKSRAPDVIIMAPDVWGKFADAGALTVALAQGGVSASGGLSTSFAGISAITSGTLQPGEVIMATRRAVDARVTDPVRLTANAIGALNVELAVVGEGLFDTDYPAELLKFAAIVPVGASAGGSSRGSK